LHIRTAMAPMRSRRPTLRVRRPARAVALVVLLAAARSADAGCGCQKPPPPPAAIRPAFASPGDTVTFFSPSFVDGLAYDVEFGGADQAITVGATAATKRDYADGDYKPQLPVAAPALPPGPTSVTVRLGLTTVMTIDATDFTMMPRALRLPQANAVTKAVCYHAAVAADGTLLIPLDVSAITARTVFTGSGRAGFRLLFGANDVTIFNTQGVVMEALATSLAPHQIDDGDDDPATDADEQGPASTRLAYDRHEFMTYRQQHATDPNELLDVDDLAWHVDDTRHIDHDHLVMAIAGKMSGKPMPGGASKPFTLKIVTTLPDDPTAPRMATRIVWDTDCAAATTTTTTVTSTSTTSTTSTTLPPAACDGTDARGTLACLCGGDTPVACEGLTIPRPLGTPIGTACRLLDRAAQESGDRAAVLAARAATLLERAATLLKRPKFARRLGPACRDALGRAVAVPVS